MQTKKGTWNIRRLLMVILAIDVGKGTEDIMIYKPNQNIENAIQVVWPSSAQIMYQTLLTTKKSPILIDGGIMGGEPWHKILYEKSKAPNTVFMTRIAAKSLKYNLKFVEEKGVNIVSQAELDEMDGLRLTTSDINWDRINWLLKSNNIDHSQVDKILLACQDHGESSDPNEKSKDFRMKAIYEKLDDNGQLSDLLVQGASIPEYLPRHKAIFEDAAKNFKGIGKSHIYIMDSSPAVILGAYRKQKQELIVNIGNGHTLAVVVESNLVKAIYETHTGGVEKNQFFADIDLLVKNSLSHEEAQKRGAHGVYIREKVTSNTLSDFYPFTLIGPNRSRIANQHSFLAHPGGSMMMAGPIGLINALNKSDNK